MKTFESFNRNNSMKKEKGYTPRYKRGYIKILFIDNDSNAMRQHLKTIKFPRRYSKDIDFLEDFAKEIGAKLVYRTKVDEKTKHKPESDDNYIIFQVPEGKEEYIIKKAEEFEFVIDTDMIDDKKNEIESLLYLIEDDFTDLRDELNENSDKEIEDKINNIIKKLINIKKII